MKDADIVNLFWERNERALQETERAYGGLCFNISFHILRNHEDAEECVNDAYLQTWNSIPPERPGSLKNWISRIVRNLSINRWKHLHRRKRFSGMTVLLDELDECIPSADSPEDELDRKELTQLLNRWLAGLSVYDRTIFLKRYWYGEAVFAEKFKRIDVDSHQMDSLYFSPEYMLIFSNQGESWTKADGQTLCLNFQLEDDQSLYLGCGYIDNGEYHELTLSKGNNFSFSIKMKEGHEYYLCVTNYSSDNAVIKKGSIAYK